MGRPRRVHIPMRYNREGPVFDRQEDFDGEVRSLATDFAPGLFAVVQVEGDNEDAWVVAWGMAFRDHAELVTTGDGLRLTAASPERAMERFTQPPRTSTRLVWAHGKGSAIAPAEAA
jgi:hypothetical protein